MLEKRLQDAKRQREQAESSPVQRIPQRPDKGPAPLSFAQQRLWFLDQLMPGGTMYNVPFALRLTGRLDLAAFEQTISELTRRHEVLRTTFAAVDGQPVQIVHPPQPLALPVTDLSQLGEEERERQVERAVVEDARRPFDLSAGPLLRVSLMRLGTEDHVLLFTLHHIVSDAWSLGVFVREVVTLYGAYLEGRPSPLPELKIQYADYAVWQREWLQGEVLEQQVGYWREQLAGAPAVLELPTDKPRPAVQTHRGGHHSFTLSEELTKRLRELSRDEGASLFMTLLAGWQLVLSRYSGQDEVVVGAPIANRHRAEVEPLIGFFVNTLALRARLGGAQSFRELLGQVKETTLGAYAHQDLPFEKLVEELQPDRKLSHTPLFQVIFTLQNAPVGELKLPGLQLSPVGRGGTERTHFDLSLGINESDDKLKCSLGYNTDLFEAATAERLAGNYERLLAEAVAAPELPISQLSMLSDEEREQLRRWGRSERDYGTLAPVHLLIAERAAERPHEVALSDAQRAVTYAELEAEADRLARLLVERGVRPGERVGVMLGRTAEAVAAMLAVWKAGGVYLPLDPSDPARRLSFVLADSAPSALVLRGALPDGASAGDALLLDLDAEGDGLAAPETGAPVVEVGGGDVAYVIYTSGSTGEPKGVEVEHRQLSNMVAASQDAFGFAGHDAAACLAPLTFDISLFELLCPLAAGARVVLADARSALDPGAALELLGGVTCLHAVPGLMRQLAEFAAEAARPYAGVRLAFVGGEAVPPDLLLRMREAFPSAGIHVLYGPTEATVICASHAVGDDARVTGQMIGRPLGGACLSLRDGRGREVPVGVTGEIYIGGAGVTRGYLNRPELTEEKYVEVDGERYYRSGDLGRWLPSGDIEFLGRRDDQV
ncbi:MAG TPA: amino acid adenylation domain-containing protein, partial [Pyrinomonadaceae bacterium]|nr:amino acid adenylation domain-containing protein [Pyrinomonadaceae bacterium]